MTTTHHPTNNRGGMPSLTHGAAIALATTLLIITVQHILLANNQPESTRLDDMMSHATKNYLRSHPNHTIVDQFVGPELFPSSSNNIWHDEFFGPLIESPLTREFRKAHHTMMMEPSFQMDEDGDQVSLVMSIPDVPLKDIDIEVLGGRIIHIKGEKNTPNSRVSFDKRFSIGQHLNESNLEAKLTKDGDLVVTAPKVVTSEKKEVRTIPITQEL
mmetsp:Transcript_21504/g.38508  ORF Transcript_21504/g.38508 Transcript_21504/m.38508 type:complete len:215 (+) Transcript_21504:84-728(+)|eukprot:CAMPEP_0201645580 /NCGR_PEP_ID=MMETSP0493-20130528/32369_1 /ASSEMBLY_ACC=CAM_ASM_000838 /TAXON_ID=420259 /ORGANISM="Thalassiosira gravida, Strain GMp14c1" /LENGTH=214 /DNA_ID=CAMNT_0048120549 /DNA_START=134 /DNA_END=778 /DNA_ORIENTATION=-